MGKWKDYFIELIVLPILILLATEIVHRGSVFLTMGWILQNMNRFIVGYLIVVSILCFFIAVTSKLKFSAALVLITAMVLSFMSNMKLKYTGEPLMPWDFALGKETTNIITYFPNLLKIVIAMAICIIICFVLFYLVFKGQRVRKQKVVDRIVFAIISIVLLSSVFYSKPLPIKQGFNIKTITWAQSKNYSVNGFLLAFILNSQWLSIEAPLDYNQKTVDDIIDGVDGRSNVDQEIKPNIIMVMSEAFWDPSVMSGVTFNKDPLPFFHALQKECTSGWLLTPVFGGGTVNTEFEVLTGHSMKFLPGGAVAYAQYVRKPMESLASILVGEGYQSIAIHSYHNWFYRRNEVFENLGFNKYISGEFFVEPARKRYYIADSEVSEMIIEETKESAEPAFIYAVTMQNHGPYKIGYDENSIQVEGNISSNSKDILEKYAQGVFDADESLKILVEYFQKSEEPTIIVFWGDHLPALGEDYQVYRDAGFYKEDGSYEEYKEMYSTPFVIWNNYSPQAKNISLSTSFLGSYVLDMAGRRGSTYTNYLSSLFKAIQTIPRQGYYAKEGIKSSDMDDYKKLQYDILFGEGYQYKGLLPEVIDKEYFLGRGKLVISSADLKKEEQKKGLFSKESTLEIKGENFVPDCQIYINEKEQPAKFIDENHLIVNLSGELITEYNGAKIQVKLYDSLDNVIAESNCLLLSKMLQ